MPRESQKSKLTRVEKIIDSLQSAYPNAHCELNYRNPLELLIATILSAQCSDKQVNLVTQELFKKYRTAQDFAVADPAELERMIRRIGLYRSKARNIQACCRHLVRHHHGRVPQTMAELVQLDGVGRKTANVVLGNAFQINEGIVVDTHVARLSRRLRLTRTPDTNQIERDLQKLVPRSDWAMFSHWLIWHGRRRCFARKPDCPNCEIRQYCPSANIKQ
jgi:endonuclease-3